MSSFFKRIVSLLLALCLLSGSALAAKTSVKLVNKYYFLYEGESAALKTKLRGVSADALVWESADEGAVSVSGGVVTGESAGRSMVRASVGSRSAKCGVVVLPRTVELEVGESLSLPCGSVERYKSSDKSVATVSKKGKITAKGAGSAKIRVSYGDQKLYVQVKVTKEESDIEESRAARLDCADTTDQIVLVEYESGSRAKLSIHERKDGRWRELHSCTAYVGKNGIGKTKEGDKRTPTGTYDLTQPFGIKADPGANMAYTKVTKHHYWCGSSGSEYYNQLVDTRKVDRKATSADEVLVSYGSVYNYCMFIDYNAAGEAGKGSCIFLHCTGSKKYTAGCIAVDEAVMKKIIQWAEPGVKIVIE